MAHNGQKNMIQKLQKVGLFIRKTRIDELPQLLNILRGDMSFVGPRPERVFIMNLMRIFQNLRNV